MTFRIGFTRDFLNPDDTIGLGDIGLAILDARPEIRYDFLATRSTELTPDQITGYDALGVLAPRVTAATLEGADDLAVIARYGVGYDTVDVAACTANGTVLTITPDGVRRPMATVVLTQLLALSSRVFEQDRAIRAGEGWSRKLELMGYGLTGKRLGLIGLGNIGAEVVRLTAPLEMETVTHDPYLDPAKAEALGVQVVALNTLLSTSDYVVIMCALTPETRHLIDADRLALMKPTAFLINAARGPIVDQAALTTALQQGKIRGAALDVFEKEPIDPADPLLALDNVIVTPHALGWTDEWAYITGRSAIESMLAVAEGRNPTYVVNKEVFETPRYQERLSRLRERQG